MNSRTGFVELAAASAFSFLEGACAPSDMVAAALGAGLDGLGLADRNTVAGVVRAHVALARAQEELGEALPFRFLPGTRLVFEDGTPDTIAYASDRAAWGRLTRLLTLGNRRATKGSCSLTLADLEAHVDGLLLISMPCPSSGHAGGHPAEPPDALLERLRAAAPGRLWLGATRTLGGACRRRLAARAALAARHGLPLLASNDCLHASPDDRPLQDILTCIRLKTHVAAAGRRLAANAERHVKSAAEMARLFRDVPHALSATLDLADRADFSLDMLRYEYPDEPVPPGWTPQSWLEKLSWDAARARFPEGVPERLRAKLDEELQLIGRLAYAPYFLTVHDIVAWAHGAGILCQGRGSAANSAVCFLLGITAVDPMRHDLLFSRFISEERAEPPDIDVDFEHERREEVMQYIYRRYGRERAGIAATHIHYRPRSAVREAGKALGLSEDMTGRIASMVWGSFAGQLEDARVTDAGMDLSNPEVARLKALTDRLVGLPRHLSQHVGGFVLTRGRLDEMVPIHNAAMPDRTFIEWDKDDIDALGLMKVDILALGMLTAIAKAFAMLRGMGAGSHTLDSVPSEDAAVYNMLCKGDSIGVFQVESRAQINMLPRLRPRTFYDLAIQVAIVRPGPIEGEMVHPYLRRRQGREKVDFPSPSPPHDPDELKTLLGKTCGVPLFQEQAMKLAIVAAAFTPAEANRLRRSMATFRHVGGMQDFEAKLVNGMVARGYEREFALRCYRQIEGFGSYGFPESHAIAFARLVYVSSWLKCHHPAAFAAALLNSQPMGFYAPAQLVRDAAEHGVEVRPIDVGASRWDNSLEPDEEGPALRLGFRQISGFRQDWADAIAAARLDAPFASMEDVLRRACLPPRAARLLADSDAFGSLALPRRTAHWEARRAPPGELPLFAASAAPELAPEPPARLAPMPLNEEVVADYQATRLSLKAHPLAFLRATLRGLGALTAAEIGASRNGQWARMAGVVLVRQRPGKGNAVFITLEDETGITNCLLWARDFERQRGSVMGARLMLADGTVQRSPEGIVHLMLRRVTDRSDLLDSLSQPLEDALDPPLARADEVVRGTPGGSRLPLLRHPRDARILPRSRDFH
jgi:error-prone DNA polymerase